MPLPSRWRTRFVVSVALVVGASQIAATSNALELFDIDFESPPHTLGSTPLVGGPEGPSSVVFNSPTVVEPDSLLPTQSLEFRLPTASPSAVSSLEQIRLDAGVGADVYRLSFDLVFDALVPADFAGESFSVLFDTPTVQSLGFQRFATDGPISVSVFQPRPSGPPSFSQTIGSVENNELLQFEIEVDTVQGLWTIAESGTTLFQGDFFVFGDDVDSIRLSLSDRDSNGDSRVRLDNLTLTAVPEPTGIALAVGVRAWAARSRRRSPA